MKFSPSPYNTPLIMLDLFIDFIQFLLSLGIFCVCIAYWRLVDAQGYKCKDEMLFFRIPMTICFLVVDAFGLVYTWKVRRLRDRQRHRLRRLARIARGLGEEPGDVFVPPKRPLRDRRGKKEMQHLSV